MPDKDELRIEVEVEDPRALLRALAGAKVSAEDRAALGRLATTHEQGRVFIYADSQTIADRAAQSVRAVMSEHGIDGRVTVRRWHPVEERWEDAAKPLPASARAQEAEHRRLIEEEDAETRKAGYAEWEVRTTLPTHRDAVALAGRLSGEGIPVQRHWRHLLIGAADEDEAQALAERLRGEAPAGSEVRCEGVGQPIWEAMHPYAIFGGLAN